ncbi:MAG: class I SAM-dependent methyltransferase [Bacteroidia bacterium]|nr:class I SAM-dependent methyltransferase [Bacteroidia bacterium]
MQLSDSTKELFYKNYYQNQANRFGSSDVSKKLKEEEKQYRAEILKLLPSDKNVKILELGCGFGSLIHTLKKAGYTNVVGIDWSEEQIQQAHKLGLNEIQQGDVLNFIAEKENSFDVIIGIDLIEHFDKDTLVGFLVNVKTALIENGIAIFRTPNIDAPFGSTYAYGDFTHQTILNKSSAEQLFNTIGYSEVGIFPSTVILQSPIKRFFRFLYWWKVVLFCRIILMISGKSVRSVVFTPNLIIKARK